MYFVRASRLRPTRGGEPCHCSRMTRRSEPWLRWWRGACARFRGALGHSPRRRRRRRARRRQVVGDGQTAPQPHLAAHAPRTSRSAEVVSSRCVGPQPPLQPPSHIDSLPLLSRPVAMANFDRPPLHRRPTRPRNRLGGQPGGRERTGRPWRGHGVRQSHGRPRDVGASRRRRASGHATRRKTRPGPPSSPPPWPGSVASIRLDRSAVSTARPPSVCRATLTLGYFPAASATQPH